MRYTPDYTGIRQIMKRHPGVHRQLHRVARERLSMMRARVPRDTGELARSGRVEDLGIQPVYKGEPRMTVAVVFYSDHAAIQQRRTGFMNVGLGQAVPDLPDPSGGRT